MIKTIVTPQNNNLYLHIPNSYIGKEVEVLLYTKEEINREDKLVQPDSMASFRGILTSEEANDLQDYVKKSREEWNTNI